MSNTKHDIWTYAFGYKLIPLGVHTKYEELNE